MNLQKLSLELQRLTDRHDGLVLAFYIGVFVAVLAASFAFSTESVNLSAWKR